MTTITPTAADIAKIKDAISAQGVALASEDENQRGSKADAAAAKRAQANAALARSRGKSADITPGSAADIGTVRIAALPTGVGGNSGDAVTRHRREARAYKVETT